MTSMCPSHAWDRYVNEQDEANAAEAAFWKENRAAIVAVAAAIAPKFLPDDAKASDVPVVVELAGEIVRQIVDRGEIE